MIKTLISMEEMVKMVNMIEITHRHFVHLHDHWPCTISRSGDGDDNVQGGGGSVIVGPVGIKWPPLVRRDLHFSHHTPSSEPF